jgi:hypothetical protein
MLAYMISQLLWLSWILIDAYFIYYPFTNPRAFDLFNNLQRSWFGVCSLMSVFITANILLVFMKKFSWFNQMMAVTGLLLFHLLFSGYLYLSNVIEGNADPTEVFALWRQMPPLWVVFMYFFDLTPPVFVFLSLRRSIPSASFWNRLFQLHSYDRLVGSLVFLQIVNACWYISMIVVYDYSDYLLNDRNSLSLHGMFGFSYVFHSVVSCVLNHRIRFMLSLGSVLETLKTKSNAYSKKPQSLPMLRTMNLNLDSSSPEESIDTSSVQYSTSSGEENDKFLRPESAYTPTPRSAQQSFTFSDFEIESVISDSSNLSPGIFSYNYFRPTTPVRAGPQSRVDVLNSPGASSRVPIREKNPREVNRPLRPAPTTLQALLSPVSPKYGNQNKNIFALEYNAGIRSPNGRPSPSNFDGIEMTRYSLSHGSLPPRSADYHNAGVVKRKAVNYGRSDLPKNPPKQSTQQSAISKDQPKLNESEDPVSHLAIPYKSFSRHRSTYSALYEENVNFNHFSGSNAFNSDDEN